MGIRHHHVKRIKEIGLKRSLGLFEVTVAGIGKFPVLSFLCVLVSFFMMVYALINIL